MKLLIRSSVLFISLTICLVITSLITFIFLITVYNNSILLSNFSNKKLHANCLAGIDYVLNEYESLELNKIHLIDLYGQQEDSIACIIKPWGIYDMVQVSSFHNGQSVSKGCLIGNKIEAPASRVALYIADKGSPVLVSGSYDIKGNVFLPETGVKYVSQNSENYMEVWNKISKNKSEKELPELNHKILDPLLHKMEHVGSFTYEQNSFKMLYAQSDSIVNTSLDTLVYVTNNQANSIDVRKYKNVTLVSTVPLVLQAASVFENVIIFAPAVTVSKGLKAKALQIFCTDSILLEEQVELSYPSVLGILKKDDAFNPFIRLKENVQVAGCIFSIQKQFQQFNAIIYLNESSTVIGDIFSQGILEYKGKIIGSIYTNECNYFSYQSGYNKNTLMNPRIDALKLPSMYAVHNLNKIKSRKEIARWF